MVQSELCTYVRRLESQTLGFVLSVPVLAQDLLEHAAFCRECGARIEAIDKQQIAKRSTGDTNPAPRGGPMKP